MTFKLIYKSFEIQLDNNLNVTFCHIQLTYLMSHLIQLTFKNFIISNS